MTSTRTLLTKPEPSRLSSNNHNIFQKDYITCWLAGPVNLSSPPPHTQSSTTIEPLALVPISRYLLLQVQPCPEGTHLPDFIPPELGKQTNTSHSNSHGNPGIGSHAAHWEGFAGPAEGEVGEHHCKHLGSTWEALCMAWTDEHVASLMSVTCSNGGQP